MDDSPNMAAVAVSVARAMFVARPAPTGSGTVMHDGLARVLDLLRAEGVSGLVGRRYWLEEYRSEMEKVDPDGLDRSESLAYWINLYNAGAIGLAVETVAQNQTSVLRVPGAFDRPWATINGTPLSLIQIEHGKIRRFGDPRVHGALVCGSASCPTLRYEPYAGSSLDAQLEAQMYDFVAGGGAVVAGDRVAVSRIFLWYGGDFVRPHRMPSLLPVSRKALRRSIERWLPVSAGSLPLVFQSYNWSLACSIAKPESAEEQ